MNDEAPVRSKKHSQDKVLRAFLEHVTGSHPAVKPGARASAPAPASVPPPADGPAPRESPGPRQRAPSGPVTARRLSLPYSVTPQSVPAAEKRRDTGSGRAAARPPDVSRTPTEVRPSPHAGVTPVGGARTAKPSTGVSAAALTAAVEGPAAGPVEIGTGTVLGDKYRLNKLLGRGGVGEVYEALHDVIGLRVAVKLIRFEYAGNSELNARFLQEARAAAAVGHPGIVQIHDVGTSPDGRTYIVMEHLDGEDLEKVLARQRQLTVAETVPILIDVLDALDAAHAKGIIHRDMKPENVFLVPGRKGERVIKLLDFGIARLADEAESTIRLTRPGSVMGTPYYMSPEQARGEQNVDAGVDVYAVGVMLYEALTGQLPFAGSNYNEVLSKVLAQPFPSVRAVRPDVPEELERVIAKATARVRRDRYATAAEFGEALEPFRPSAAVWAHPDAAGVGAAGRTPTGETPLPTTSRTSAPPPRPVAAPEAAVQASAPPAAEPPRVCEAVPQPQRPRRMGAWVAVGLAVAVLVAGGLFFGLRGGVGEGSGAASGPAGPGAVPATVHIRILGAPPEAEVKFDGRTVDSDFTIPAGPDEHTVEVRVPGRTPVLRTVRASADLALDLAADFAVGDSGDAGPASAP